MITVGYIHGVSFSVSVKEVLIYQEFKMYQVLVLGIQDDLHPLPEHMFKSTNCIFIDKYM